MQHKITLTLSSLIIASAITAFVLPKISYAEENHNSSTSATTHTENKDTSNFNSGILDLIKSINKEASASAQKQNRNLSEIIARADTLITNRINQLNDLSARINNDSRLSAEEKTSLTAEINSAINGLTALKTKIDADTNASTAMADAKTIFTGYRIYEELEPKISLLIILNNVKTMATNLQGLLPQLQNVITTFQNQSKDVTQLNTLMSDINTQLTNILTTANNDINILSAVNVNTQNPQTTFQQVRQDITNAVKTSFGQIRTDIQAMRPILKGFINPEASNKPSSTPSATTSATPQ